MNPRLRKFTLTAHIVFSVGWLGAIVPYLALAVAGLASRDAQIGRATYLSLEVIGRYVIVPFSVAALVSGLVQSLGTQWGLIRHWWIVAKFALTVAAITILLRHMQDVSRVARMGKDTMLTSARFRPELIHAAGGLVVVLAAALLSMFKPCGMTPYGLRQVSNTNATARAMEIPIPVGEPVLAAGKVNWGRIIVFHAVGLALLAMIILHLTKGGLHHH